MRTEGRGIAVCLKYELSEVIFYINWGYERTHVKSPVAYEPSSCWASVRKRVKVMMSVLIWASASAWSL